MGVFFGGLASAVAKSEQDQLALNQQQRAQVWRKKVIASEIFCSSQERGTQIFFAEVFGPEEQRTETSSSSVAVSRCSREARGKRRGAAGSRSC